MKFGYAWRVVMVRAFLIELISLRPLEKRCVGS